MSEQANILDFLAIPRKNSASVYELLAEEASHEYLRNNTPPSQHIAKVARERQLNDEEIRRVVELTNHLINRELSQQSDDQLFTFPVARPEEVHEYLQYGSAAEEPVEAAGELGKAASFEKVASGEYDPTLVTMVKFATEAPTYSEIQERLQFDRHYAAFSAEVDMIKQASEEDSEPELSDAVRERLERTILKKAEAAYDAAIWRVQDTASRIADLWSNMGLADKEDFAKAACHILGVGGAEYLLSRLEGDHFAASQVDEYEKVAEHLSVYEDAPEVKLLYRMKEDLDNLQEKKAFLGTLAAAGTAALEGAKAIGTSALRGFGRFESGLTKGLARSRKIGLGNTLLGQAKVPIALGAGMAALGGGSIIRGAVGGFRRSVVPVPASTFGEEFSRIS